MNYLVYDLIEQESEAEYSTKNKSNQYYIKTFKSQSDANFYIKTIKSFNCLMIIESDEIFRFMKFI